MTKQNSLIIEKAKKVYLKHGGKNHRLIEKAMHDAGCLTFTRRVLYSRTYKNGKRQVGWAEKYGWNKELTPQAETRAVASVTETTTRDEKQETRDELPLTDFKAWLKTVTPNMKWDWAYQQLIYDKLNDIATGKTKRLMIFLPPRHGKSELVTVRYSAWRLLNDPSLNIILGSYNQRLANRFSRKVRITWEDSVNANSQTTDSIREHSCSFVAEGNPSVTNVNSTDRSQESGFTPASSDRQPLTANCQPSFSRRRLNTVSEWETGLGGGVRAVGVGGGITGFGAGLVIIDDPVKSRAEAESKTYRDKVWEWFCDDLYTRLEPNASMILIQTRWHEDDLAGRLLKDAEDGGEKWDVISLPALAEGDVLSPKVTNNIAQGKDEVRHPGYTSNIDRLPEGEQPPVPPLLPRMFSNREEWIEYDRKLAEYNNRHLKQKADQPNDPAYSASSANSALNPSSDPLGRQLGEPLCPERFSQADLLRIKRQLGSYSFSALYQQRPTPPEGGLFKRKWFSRIVDRAPDGLKWVRAYDLAVSTSTSADYTASFRCALDKSTGDLYIADGFRKRIEFPEQRRFIVQKILDEPNTEHGVEQALHGQAFIQELRREHRLFGKAFRGIKVTSDKFTRALSWANLAEEGKIVLVRGHWIEDFLDEITTFPNSTHDDQIDAISLAVQMLEQRKFTAVSF